MSERERALIGPRALKEPGSPDWCWQTIDYFQASMRHVSKEWRQAQEVLDELVAVRAWEVIPAGHPYGTLDKMLKAEVGLDARAINDLIRQAELAAHGGNAQLGHRGFQRGDNVTSLNRGSSETYAVRRLRRDGHADLADKVERGELSANRAAVKAGFRHRTMSIPADDAERAFRRLSGDRGMDREQLVLLAKLLKDHLLTEKD